MNGTTGRVLSGIGYIVILIGAAQAGGLFAFLPPKAAMMLIGIAATLKLFTERAFGGGASTVNVVQAQANEIQGTATK